MCQGKQGLGLGAEVPGAGDTVLLLGHANGHRQDRPAAADPEGCVTVAEMADLTRLGDLDGSRLSFVIRPCAPIEDVTPLLRALRDQFPLLRGQHPSEWCYVMSDRRSSLRLATEGADLLLVLGRPDGPRRPPGLGTGPLSGVTR
ncbi:hypothetical protein ACFQ0T_36535 [Kitasatospora gansuensis]